MRKILFVDDDPNVLEGLRRTFRDLRGKWALAFGKSGQEALNLLKKVEFDVVVSDTKVSGIGGIELLTQVMENHPHVVRVVLSGQTDQQTAMQAMNPAHLYLTKPYNADKLKTLLTRACTLRDRLTSPSLKKVVSNMKSLPSIPALYAELMRELGSENASIQRVGEIISQDMGMLAKILKLVNSAFFGCRGTIESPSQAAAFLGLEMLKGLVMSVQIFSQFKADNLGGFSISRLWNHSMSVGVNARDAARNMKADKTVVGDAFMGGMLHDTGKLVLANNFPNEYAKAAEVSERTQCPMWEAELQVFGATHGDVGAYLMGLWGLPDPIVESIAFHHYPIESNNNTFAPLTLIHTGNEFAKSEGEDEDTAISRLDMDYMGKLGLEDKAKEWWSMTQEMALQE